MAAPSHETTDPKASPSGPSMNGFEPTQIMDVCNHLTSVAPSVTSGGFRMVVNLHTVIHYYRTFFSIIEQSNLKVL